LFLPSILIFIIMKSFFFASITSLLTSLVSTQDKITEYLIVHSSSTVTIDGKTNVNKYQCAIEEYKGNDTLLLTAVRGKGAQFKKGVVKLNASAFNCAMNVITKDFRESIQSDTYPYIQINFISFERVPKYEATEEKFKGKLTITLAEVAVPAEVRCSIIKDEKNLIHLRGKRTFKFSDFNLVPPTKMMGAIKVDENITVNFHLVLSMN